LSKARVFFSSVRYPVRDLDELDDLCTREIVLGLRPVDAFLGDNNSLFSFSQQVK
jgi:hypothetical protein